MKLEKAKLEKRFINLMSEYKMGKKDFYKLGKDLREIFEIDEDYFMLVHDSEDSEEESDGFDYYNFYNIIEKSLERKLTTNERSMVHILSTAIIFYVDNEEEEEE